MQEADRFIGLYQRVKGKNRQVLLFWLSEKYKLEVCSVIGASSLQSLRFYTFWFQSVLAYSEEQEEGQVPTVMIFQSIY